MQIDLERIGLRFQGRVQGVGFRWFVLREANRLRLRGWVRNARDGSVEVRAEGPPAAIREFRSIIAQGPPAARVSAVATLPPSDEELPAVFEIGR